MAAWLAAGSRGGPAPRPSWLFDRVLESLDASSEVAEGIRRARRLPPGTHLSNAAAELGNGSRVLCQDTVPLALWISFSHLDDYRGAILRAIEAGGDTDTTGAMAGGVVAARVGTEGIPEEWLLKLEPLPSMEGA